MDVGNYKTQLLKSVILGLIYSFYLQYTHHNFYPNLATADVHGWMDVVFLVNKLPSYGKNIYLYIFIFGN